MTTEHECDVVIVGLGGSGATAAITAREAGAKVIAVERTDDGGGSTRDSGGNIRTFVDVEKSVTHYSLITEHKTSPDVVRACVETANELQEWFTGRGGQVVPAGPHGKARGQIHPSSHPGSAFAEIDGAEGLGERFRVVTESWKQGQGADPSGATLWQVLAANLERLEIPVLYSTRAERLIQDASGRVVGVRCNSSEGEVVIRAKRAVVLTTGGFADDPKLKYDNFGFDLPTFCAPGRKTGDGIRMAQAVGAELCHMRSGAISFGYKIPEFPAAFRTALRGPGFIIVDRDGNRYMNEAAIDTHSAGKVALVPDPELLDYRRVPSYVIFDEETRYDGPIATTISGHNGGFPWSRDNSDEVRKGWISAGDSIAQLAERLGLPAENLEHTIEQFNKTCEEGAPDEFGREHDSMRSLASAPFYGLPCWPGIVNTQGGPRRDGQCRVLNPFGEPIAGLYSAGEMGSMWWDFYPGAGNITEALATGRIAGEEAAANAPAS